MSEAVMNSQNHNHSDVKAFILGVGVAGTDLVEVLAKIDKNVNYRHKKPFFIVTVNPEFVVLAQSDRDFQTILNTADLAIADGIGLKLAIPSLSIVPGRRLVAE